MLAITQSKNEASNSLLKFRGKIEASVMGLYTQKKMTKVNVQQQYIVQHDFIFTIIKAPYC